MVGTLVVGTIFEGRVATEDGGEAIGSAALGTSTATVMGLVT